MNVLVSACLLGENCKYNGGNNHVQGVSDIPETSGIRLIPFCAETAGGLPTPRIPAERVGDCVINKNGEDVTAQFMTGAQAALAMAKKHNCKAAILKKNSPSCGCGTIYDGTFSGVLVDGNGVTAQLLLENGIIIYNEESFGELVRSKDDDV